MRYQGREINWFSIWSKYIDNLDPDAAGEFHTPVFCPHPDHDNTRSPAFQLNISKPLVYCFSPDCGFHKGGTYERAISVIEGITEREARKLILLHTRIPTTGEKVKIKKRDKETLPIASDIVQAKGKAPVLDDRTLSEYSYLPKNALNYLERRGIQASTRSRWQIGFDEEAERITIPVFDRHRRLRFIIKRGIFPWQRPAYLYPKDSAKSALLFGVCNLDEGLVRSDGLIVVEGSFDCINLHQLGFPNTVAILGSSLSLKQRMEIAKLRPKVIYLFFDRDGAGIAGMQKAERMLSAYPLRIPLYPAGRFDPGALESEREAARSISASVTLLEFKKRIAKSGLEFNRVARQFGKEDAVA